MSRKKKETVELRFYEIPQGEPLLALLGEEWIRVYGQDAFYSHFHNLMEIGYCRRGAGSVLLETEEKRYQTSMLTIIPANYPHSTLSDGSNPNHWEYLFFDPAAVISEMYPEDPAYRKELLDCINMRASLLSEMEYPAIAGIIKMIMEEMRDKKHHYREMVKGLMQALCVEIMRINGAEPVVRNQEQKLRQANPIAPAIEYITNNYATQVKAQELAQVCGMSETHFRRRFEEYVNMPPIDYLNLVRIQNACELLKRTNDSMEHVAAQVGFTTTSTFNRNFKKFLKTSPYQWKINPNNYEQKLLGYHISAKKGW